MTSKSQSVSVLDHTSRIILKSVSLILISSFALCFSLSSLFSFRALPGVVSSSSSLLSFVSHALCILTFFLCPCPMCVCLSVCLCHSFFCSQASSSSSSFFCWIHCWSECYHQFFFFWWILSFSSDSCNISVITVSNRLICLNLSLFPIWLSFIFNHTMIDRLTVRLCHSRSHLALFGGGALLHSVALPSCFLFLSLSLYRQSSPSSRPSIYSCLYN